jgi:hypothetical protein
MTNKYLVFTMALVSFLEDHSKTFQWFNDFDYGQIRVKNTNYRFVKK